MRYLSGLCEQEVADRYQKRVQRWTREAGLPLNRAKNISATATY